MTHIATMDTRSPHVRCRTSNDPLAQDTSKQRKRSEKVARPILQALASKPTPLNGERLSWFRSDSDPAAYIFWTPGRLRN
jgi:hypothetical protein